MLSLTIQVPFSGPGLFRSDNRTPMSSWLLIQDLKPLTGVGCGQDA